MTPEPVQNLSKKEEEVFVLVPAGDGQGEGQIEQAFRLWNELAARTGLPRAMRLTEQRRRALRQRLIECGGIEGWQIALRMVSESAFLMGGRRQGVTDLDFILQPASFTRLMESRYADRDRKQSPNMTGAEALHEIGANIRAKIGEDAWGTI